VNALAPSESVAAREDHHRVAADHPAKPDSPGDLHAGTWRYVLRRTFREFSRDGCLDLGAGLTFYAVLSLFPALIALLSLVGLIGRRDSVVQAFEDMARQLQVPSADEVLLPTLRALAEGPTQPGLALVVSLATALWSASGYVGAFGRAMNQIYEIREGRPFWKLRPLMLLVTLAAIAMAGVVALALVLTGPAARAVGSVLGVGDTALTMWNIAKWPAILLVVVLIVAILYYATPNVQQPRFRWISPGALVALVVWILATLGFGFYVSSFGSYDRVYGSLAGIVVFLLWVWITNLALLFGAELDSELERGRQLQAGIPAEQELQLPPRDTRGIRKKEHQEREDELNGRRLRDGSAASQHDAQPPEGEVSTARTRVVDSQAEPGTAGVTVREGTTMEHSSTTKQGTASTPDTEPSPEKASVMAATAATAATAVGMSLIRRRSLGGILLGVLALGALQLWRRRTANAI
jgi:membrane protein